ncbi:MAG TPA: CoA-binding protein, partial [Vicinamibacterales bacterium]|nr:CoA-binding protein [Vicinamibacterales bacterium]
ATMYVPPHIGEQLIEQIAQKGIRELWVNPGAESDALIAKARSLGLQPIEACSIMGIGLSPSEF